MTEKDQLDDAIAFQRKHGWEETDRLIRLNLLHEQTHLRARSLIRFERILLALRPEYV